MRMRVGNLVKLDPGDYPQYKGKLALIVEERDVDKFVVMVGAKLHPYLVHRVSIEVVNASR